MLKIFFITVSWLFSTTIHAAIFLCDDATEIPKYQDTPCINNQVDLEFTDYLQPKQKMIKIQPKKYTTKKQAVKLQKELSKQKEKQLKLLSQHDKQKQKEHDKWLLEQKLKKEKTEREQRKCRWAKYKINSIQQQLKEANGTQQKLKLTETLDLYKFLKRQHC